MVAGLWWWVYSCPHQLRFLSLHHHLSLTLLLLSWLWPYHLFFLHWNVNTHIYNYFTEYEEHTTEYLYTPSTNYYTHFTNPFTKAHIDHTSQLIPHHLKYHPTTFIAHFRLHNHTSSMTYTVSWSGSLCLVFVDWLYPALNSPRTCMTPGLDASKSLGSSPIMLCMTLQNISKVFRIQYCIRKHVWTGKNKLWYFR